MCAYTTVAFLVLCHSLVDCIFINNESPIKNGVEMKYPYPWFILPYEIDSSLWQMTTTYDACIYNHFPDSNGITPVDHFSGSQFPRHKLNDVHTWGCPAYVLDPALRQGKKLPK